MIQSRIFFLAIVLDLVRDDFTQTDATFVKPPATVCAPLVVSLTVKPNQPEDDGEYGVPDVALPNVALPIARGQCGCLTKNPLAFGGSHYRIAHMAEFILHQLSHSSF